jgi:hypothetical protein
MKNRERFKGATGGGAAYRIAAGVRASIEDDRIVILDTRAGQFYLCDGVKAEFWRLLSQGETVDGTIDRVSLRYNGARDRIESDLVAFLDELLSRRLIVRPDAVPRVRRVLLFLRALWELIAYDLRIRTFGFQKVYGSVLHRPCTATGPLRDGKLTAQVVGAVAAAARYYWRPVRCLQRSVAATRLLRSFGVPAELIIGYRPKPFLSHAWVEVSGHVVNDSQALAERLTVLDRI